MKLSFIYSFLLLVILSHPVSAAISTGEESCFNMGSKTVGGGVSFSKPGMMAIVDFGIHDLFSIGGMAGFNKYTEYRGWKITRFPALGRVAIHPLNFTFLADHILIRDRIDIYGGLAAGYVLTKARWNGVTDEIGTPEESGIFFGEYLGVRLFINERWLIFAEDCGPATNFTLGVAMRF